MYLDHFGLSQAPFKITPNTGFFYTGGNRGAILDALLYAITHGEGIVKVTGEIGSGKTMLCRMLESLLPENIEVIYLPNPSIGRDEILFVIAGELGLITKGQRTAMIIRALQSRLIENHAQGRQIVIIVDEAQAMPLESLEEVRLLSNLETETHKLLQIVLFGQLDLDHNLAQPQMRQLRERITHNFVLPPFQKGSLADYLMFRMRAAGYHGPDLFGADAVKLIANASQGITRRINVLADKTLLAAFAENTHDIRPRHVKAAINDSEFSAPRRLLPLKQIGFALALLVLGIALGTGWQNISHLYSPLAAPAPLPVSAPIAKPASYPPVATAILPAVQPVIQEEPVQASSAQATGEAPPSVPEESAQAPIAPQANPLPSVPTPTSSLLQQRLEATQAWLDKADEAHFSIQLMAIHSDAESLSRLERFFRGNAQDLQQLYVYPSSLIGKSGYGVLFGNFSSRTEALASLASLPGEMKISRPIIRTVMGVKAEINNQRHDNN
jgi:MSHA biogenesis protein MshM